MTKESDIAYEDGPFWVLQTPKGFEVYINGITHATRCARIGYKGEDGLKRAIAEVNRRKLIGR